MKTLSQVLKPISQLFKSYEISISINVEPDYNIVHIYLASDYISKQHVQSVNNIIGKVCAVSYDNSECKFYISFTYEDEN